jgi:hypothetical protein
LCRFWCLGLSDSSKFGGPHVNSFVPYLILVADFTIVVLLITVGEVLPYRPHQLSELPPDPIFPYALLPTPAAGILGSVVPPLAVPVTAAVGSSASVAVAGSGAVGSGGTESGGASGVTADVAVKVNFAVACTCLITGFNCLITVTKCSVCMIPTCVPRLLLCFR